MADVILSIDGDLSPLDRKIRALTRSNSINFNVNDRPANLALGRIRVGADAVSSSIEAANQRVIAFGASALVIGTTIRAFSELAKATVIVEKALTEINSVFGLSSSSLTKFSKDLFQIARDTGQAFDIATKAALEFSRQGLTVEQTTIRVRDALTLTRQSGLDVAKSVDSLTAAINGFAREGLNSTTIINKLIAVDTKFAVSSRDLAEALSRVGSTAQDAGLGFDQLIGLVTSAQQITARGGAVIGNAFKTIFTRIQRSDTLDQLENLGVAVRDLRGNALSADKILQNLAKTFDTLSSAQQQQVSELSAGIFQINQFKSILSDLGRSYNVFTQATAASSVATTEAEKRNQALNKSLSVLLQNTKTTATEIASVIGSITFAEPLKKALEGVNSNFIVDALRGAGDPNAEDIGAVIGRSILEGVGNVLSGPGFIFAFATLAKVVAKTTSVLVKDISGLFSARQQELQVVKGIEQTLFSASSLDQKRFASAKSVLDQERVILDILQKQNAAKAAQVGATATLVRRLPVSTRKELARGAADGYLPSVMRMEKQAVRLGVGGAKPSARPVVVPNFNYGGGKRGTIVANTDEYLVPNFKGSGGSAIFNPQMISAYGGVPRGAKKINAAGGYVPNFASISRDKIAELLESRLFSNFIYENEDGEVGQFNQAQHNVRHDLKKGSPPPKGYKTFAEYYRAKNLVGLRVRKTGEKDPRFSRFRLDRFRQITARGQTYDVMAGGYIPDSSGLMNLPKGLKNSINIPSSGYKKTAAKGYVPNFVGEGSGFNDFFSFLAKVDPSYLGAFAKIQKQDPGLGKFLEQVVDARGPLEQRQMGQMLKGKYLQFTPQKFGLGTTSYVDLDLGPQGIRKQITEVFERFQMKSPKFAEGYLPNFAPVPKSKSFGKSPIDGKRSRQLEMESGSKLMYTFNPKTKQIELSFLRSEKKGDGFSLFGALAKRARRSYLPIHSSTLIPQSLRQTPEQLAELDNYDQLKARYPQLRYREIPGANTSGLVSNATGSYKYKFNSLKELKKIVNDNPRTKNLNLEDLTTLAYAKGYIPNFHNPIAAAIAREKEASGLPLSQIYLDQNSSVKSSGNPAGLLVANRRDEPLGGFQGIRRVLKQGGDPKKSGMASGHIPNFAEFDQARRVLGSEPTDFNQFFITKEQSGQFRSLFRSLRQEGTFSVDRFRELTGQIEGLAKSVNLTQSGFAEVNSKIRRAGVKLQANLVTGAKERVADEQRQRDDEESNKIRARDFKKAKAELPGTDIPSEPSAQKRKADNNAARATKQKQTEEAYRQAESLEGSNARALKELQEKEASALKLRTELANRAKAARAKTIDEQVERDAVVKNAAAKGIEDAKKEAQASKNRTATGFFSSGSSKASPQTQALVAAKLAQSAAGGKASSLASAGGVTSSVTNLEGPSFRELALKKQLTGLSNAQLKDLSIRASGVEFGNRRDNLLSTRATLSDSATTRQGGVLSVNTEVSDAVVGLAKSGTLLTNFDATVKKLVIGGTKLEAAYKIAGEELLKSGGGNAQLSRTQTTLAYSLVEFEKKIKQEQFSTRKNFNRTARLNQAQGLLNEGKTFDELDKRQQAIVRNRITEDARSSLGFGGITGKQQAANPVINTQVEGLVAKQIAELNVSGDRQLKLFQELKKSSGFFGNPDKALNALLRKNNIDADSSLGRNLTNQASGLRQAKQARFQNAGLIASFALPAAAGFIPEGEGGKRSSQLLGGVAGALQGAGTGAALGSFIGPVGTAVGAGLGAVVVGVAGVIGKLSLSLEELAGKIQEVNAKNTEQINVVSSFVQLQQQINDGIQSGASDKQIQNLTQQQTGVLSRVSDPKNRSSLLAAGGNIDKLIEVLQRVNKAGDTTGRSGDVLGSLFSAKEGKFKPKQVEDAAQALAVATDRTSESVNKALGTFRSNLASDPIKAFSDFGSSLGLTIEGVRLGVEKLKRNPEEAALIFRRYLEVTDSFAESLAQQAENAKNQLSSNNFSKLLRQASTQLSFGAEVLGANQSSLNRRSSERSSAAVELGNFNPLNKLALDLQNAIAESISQTSLNRTLATQQGIAGVFGAVSGNEAIKSTLPESFFEDIAKLSAPEDFVKLAVKLGENNQDLKQELIKIANGIELIGVNGENQIQEIKNSASIQKIRVRIDERNRVLSNGGFDTNRIESLFDAIQRGKTVTGARGGEVNQINGLLDQIGIADQSGLPETRRTRGIRESLASDSARANFSEQLSTILGETVGNSAEAISTAVDKITSRQVVTKNDFGNRDFAERVKQSLESINFDPEKAVQDLAGGKNIAELVTKNKVSLGEGGVSLAVSGLNTPLQDIATKLGAGGPIAAILEQISQKRALGKELANRRELSGELSNATVKKDSLQSSQEKRIFNLLTGEFLRNDEKTLDEAFPTNTFTRNGIRSYGSEPFQGSRGEFEQFSAEIKRNQGLRAFLSSEFKDGKSGSDIYEELKNTKTPGKPFEGVNFTAKEILDGVLGALDLEGRLGKNPELQALVAEIKALNAAIRTSDAAASVLEQAPGRSRMFRSLGLNEETSGFGSENSPLSNPLSPTGLTSSEAFAPNISALKKSLAGGDNFASGAFSPKSSILQEVLSNKGNFSTGLPRVEARFEDLPLTKQTTTKANIERSEREVVSAERAVEKAKELNESYSIQAELLVKLRQNQDALTLARITTSDPKEFTRKSLEANLASSITKREDIVKGGGNLEDILAQNQEIDRTRRASARASGGSILGAVQTGAKESITALKEEEKILRDANEPLEIRLDLIRRIQAAEIDLAVVSADSFGSFAKSFTARMTELRGQINDFSDVGRGLADSLEGQLGNAFGDFVVGAKTAKDAFRDFALGVLSDASRALASKAIQGLLGAAFGAATGANQGGPIKRASGGTVPALLTGGEYYFGPRAAQSLGKDFLGKMNSGVLSSQRYASGGLVRGGSGVKDDVPARLQPGGFVVKRSAVQKYGADYMDSLASGRVQKRFIGGAILGALLGGGIGYATGGKKGAVIGAIGGGVLGGFAQNAGALKGIGLNSAKGTSALGKTASLVGQNTTANIAAPASKGLFSNLSPIQKSLLGLGGSAVLGLASRAFAPAGPEQGRIMNDQEITANRLLLENNQREEFGGARAKGQFAQLQLNPQGGYSLAGFGGELATRRFAAGGSVMAESPMIYRNNGGYAGAQMPDIPNFAAGYGMARTPEYNRGGSVAPVIPASPAPIYRAEGGYVGSPVAESNQGGGNNGSKVDIKVEINNMGQVSTETKSDGGKGEGLGGQDFGEGLAQTIKGYISEQLVEQSRNGGFFKQNGRTAKG